MNMGVMGLIWIIAVCYRIEVMYTMTIVNVNYITMLVTIDSDVSIYIANSQRIIKGNDFVLEVYELTQSSSVPNANDPLISSIRLGYCENIIRPTLMGNNNDIVIAKFDVIRLNDITPQIEYRLYSKNGGNLLPIPMTTLSQCESYNVTHSIPIINKHLLPQYTIANDYYTNLNIDILNSNHPIYNDHCMPFNPDGIDIILDDRREVYYQSPALCEHNCNYQRIDYASDLVICKCPFKVQSLSTQLSANVAQALPESDVIYFQIVSCTMILTLWRTFSYNTGMLVFISIIIVQIGTIFVFLCCGMPKLNQRLRESKQTKKEPKKKRNPFYSDKKEFVNYFGMKEQVEDEVKLEKAKKVFFDKEESYNVFDPVNNPRHLPQKLSQVLNVDEKDDDDDDNTKDNPIGNNNVIGNSNDQYSNRDEDYIYRVPIKRGNYVYFTRKQKDEITSKSNNYNNKDLNNDILEITKDQVSLSIIGSERKLNLNQDKGYIKENDHNDLLVNYKQYRNKNITKEPNTNKDNEIQKPQANPNDTKDTNNKPPIKISYGDFRFDYSLQHDKRNYCQVLWYTFTERQIFFGIFCHKSKYELKSIKLSLFLFNLSMDLFFNCFYYSDTLISNKYHNKGTLPLTHLIIKSIISSISTGLLNFIINCFFMYVKYFEVLSLEYIPEDKYRIYSLEFLQEIQKKLMTAFVIELLLLIFGLYYTTLFFGVFPQTQICVFIGLGASLLFELGLILIMSFVVSCMRYCSIKRNKRITYYTSLYIKNRM